MLLPELRMCFADPAELAAELEANFKHGRAFAKGAEGVGVLADCTLVLVHPGDSAELKLPAQAVMVCDGGAMRGIGLQLRPFDAAVIALIEGFIAGVRLPAEPAAAAATSDEVAAAAAAPTASEEPQPTDTSAAQADAGDASDGDADDAEPDADGDDLLASDLQSQPARHERLRKLSLNEQQKIARTGDLNDRVTLERIYGKHVWEGLLHNPKLTVPEVARIARKGTMPRPLLEYIVDNNTWIQAAIVRRALLGNPRVSSEAIMKLLRITPKHELRTIYKTTTYSTQVRECARKVLDA
jgi:hypothetical protein